MPTTLAPTQHVTTPTKTATVCQIVHSLEVGGTEVLVAQFARHLRSDFRMVIACLDRLGPLGEQLRREGFDVKVIGRDSGIDWKCGRRLSKFLKSEHVDLIHAHQYTPFFQGLVSRFFYRRPPILFTEHGRHHPDVPSPKRALANRLLMQSRDRVVAVGESVKQALIDNENIPADRIHTVYNGVDLSPYKTVADDHQDVRSFMRKELQLAPDAFVVAQVARLNRLKDHSTAIRTMSRLKSSGVDAKLLIVGNGEERPAIESLIRELDLESHVRMLGTRNDIPRVLSAADAFLLTSISEGIPLTLIEAMAAGLPIVSTNVGGVAEVVLNNTIGLLANAGDDETLATHLQRLKTESALRKTFGEAGRARAFAKFSEAHMHDAYREIYQEMLHA